MPRRARAWDVGGLGFTDAVTGLSLDVRVRALVHQANGFTERGMSLAIGWDATPSSPLGLTTGVALSWGGPVRGGAEALWSNQMAYGMGSHQMYGAGDRVDAEVGYALPLGARFVGTPRVGLPTSQYGRDYRVGYGLGVLDRCDVNFELGVDAQRRENPLEGGASNGFMGRVTLGLAELSGETPDIRRCPTIARPRYRTEGLRAELRETAAVHAAVEALRAAVDQVDGDEPGRDAAAAAWHAASVVRLFCSTYGGAVTGVRVNEDSSSCSGPRFPMTTWST